MPVQIGVRESDFSNPLGLLSDCHRRIEKFLGVLIQVCAEAAGSALNEGQRAALEKALTYFRESAPKHTADEEESLFPRLREDLTAGSALESLKELEHDHQAAARDHELVDSLGSEWLSFGSLAPQQRSTMQGALQRLSELYRRHIAIEDGELFPLAARVLNADQLRAIGGEMAERRQVMRDSER